MATARSSRAARSAIGRSGGTRTGSDGLRPRRSQRLRRSRTLARRRRLLAGVALLALVSSVALGLWSAASRPRSPRPSIVSASHPTSGLVIVRFRGRELARADAPVDSRHASRAELQGSLRAELSATVPAATSIRVGSARVTYRLDQNAATARAARLAPEGGDVEVAGRAIAAVIPAPVLKQRLHNDCEAAALQVLLATAGVRVDQLRLQGELPRSGPLDPRGAGAVRVWGDPDAGFVGRANGGGPAGGFGVYEGPLAGVARREGVELRDLTGTTPSRLYGHVLSGHAILAWVGLADGPFGRWRTPAGRRIEVNFNEHAVVLVGLERDGLLRVVDPLSGTRTAWSKAQFERMWGRLGRRALAT